MHAGKATSDQVLKALLALPASVEQETVFPETAPVKSASGRIFSIQERPTDPTTGAHLLKHRFFLVIRNPQSGQIHYARLPGTVESYGLRSFAIRAVNSPGTAVIISRGAMTYVVSERNGTWILEKLFGVFGKQLLYIMRTQNDPFTGQHIRKPALFMVRYDLASKQRSYVRLRGQWGKLPRRREQAS